LPKFPIAQDWESREGRRMRECRWATVSLSLGWSEDSIAA